jgi:hypothetical protein
MCRLSQYPIAVCALNASVSVSVRVTILLSVPNSLLTASVIVGFPLKFLFDISEKKGSLHELSYGIK